MADEDGLLQAQRIDHVPIVEREIEHVAQLVAFFGIAIAG
jgi:hypothetical protein